MRVYVGPVRSAAPKVSTAVSKILVWLRHAVRSPISGLTACKYSTVCCFDGNPIAKARLTLLLEQSIAVTLRSLPDSEVALQCATLGLDKTTQSNAQSQWFDKTPPRTMRV